MAKKKNPEIPPAPLNELEILIEIIIHTFCKKYEKNPEGGVKVNDDCKMKYTDILKALKRLKTFIYDWNQITNYSICLNCERFEPESKEYQVYGRCKAPDRDKPQCVQCYNTCWRNTDGRYSKEDMKFHFPKYPSDPKEEGE